jgi:hypothetical protein
MPDKYEDVFDHEDALVSFDDLSDEELMIVLLQAIHGHDSPEAVYVRQLLAERKDEEKPQ